MNVEVNSNGVNKLIKYNILSDEEMRECLEIVSKEDCIIKLTWFVRYNGWHNLLIKDGMTFEECKSKLPKFYGVYNFKE